MSHDDVERLTRIATSCGPALTLYARQWLDAASADDAVQEALVALLCQRRPPDNPAAWLYRAVRNAAIDHGRANQRRRRREQTVALQRREMFETDGESLVDSETAENWLNRLSPEHREAVVLRIWGDLAFAEIAAIMGLGVSTVHDRYTAALRELRRLLEQKCDTKTN